MSDALGLVRARSGSLRRGWFDEGLALGRVVGGKAGGGTEPWWGVQEGDPRLVTSEAEDGVMSDGGIGTIALDVCSRFDRLVELGGLGDSLVLIGCLLRLNKNNHKDTAVSV